MVEARLSRGRPHDAQGAQAAILDAAEAAFAEHGFAGARIDAIAAASGYNKSLIFHYFGDKLGLYTAVLRRADQQGSYLETEFLGWVSSDAPLTRDTFRAFIENAIRKLFDYYVANPRLLRILAWEEAEGWTTLAKISSVFDPNNMEPVTAFFDRAQRAGLIRPEISPRLALEILQDFCRTYLTSLPLFQIIAPVADSSSPEALARAREQLVAFIVHGIIPDPCR